MGLDMYARWRDDEPATPVDFIKENDHAEHEVGETFFTWRKHPNLHAWMWEQYLAKGGRAKSPEYMEGFNAGQQVSLVAEDLDRLERAINHDGFYEPGKVKGFFFGESSIEDRDEDRKFIVMARALLARGKHIYYTSWW